MVLTVPNRVAVGGEQRSDLGMSLSPSTVIVRNSGVGLIYQKVNDGKI